MLRVNVQNVNKNYYIYAKPHDRLLQALLRKPMHKVFEVLKDISFEVGLGQSLGIIGDNGAGKSTLLKLLAGTVQPTTGTIEVNGRVAALLELGAGFHPEFTGRQNIYLNASLLGISDEEIKKKEDEIIAFAELEEFIDRPVRTYSSGMYVRLAFSIATMVDPDILIIDEALAVGDMGFQKKCIQRMNHFKEQGRTMLFCSHSMYHVQELCERVIWLENGRVRKAGKCDEVVAQYEEFCNKKRDKNQNRTDGEEKRGVNPTASSEDQPLDVAPEKDCLILSFAIKSIEGKVVDNMTLNSREPLRLEMAVEVMTEGIMPNFGFAIMNGEEEIVGATLTNYDSIPCGPYNRGDVINVSYVIDFIPLRVGSFMLLGAVSDDTGLLWYDSKRIGPVLINPEKGMGRVSLKGSWQIEPEKRRKGGN
ncbi:MAG: ATP-binding cassette domain-containing protein [Desulfamplus sp.]|nr:ATP-binding cassette domain-containing protein [Desulfamplus sp.]